MEQALFSIFIPTWNNLKYLKLCIESIRRHSKYRHQIIVHVNEGKDGTLEWVQQQSDIDYTFSDINMGVCLAMNKMRSKVKTKYICFVNDDMYLLPGWDDAFWNEIQKLNGEKFFFLSASVIQPHQYPYKGTGVKANYGDSIETFQEETLLKEYMNYKISNWKGSTTPPNIVHLDLWDLVGGYSLEFSPGLASDPDFTAKLWFVGVRYLKGLSDARAYHFECKSTGRLRMNDYQSQFLFKWKMANSTFRRYIICLGEPWDENVVVANRSMIKVNSLRVWVKSIVYAVRRKYGTLDSLWSL